MQFSENFPGNAAFIFSFDEAKRDTRARRPSSAAPESRPVIHSVDAIPAFESPFRHGQARGDGCERAAHAPVGGCAADRPREPATVRSPAYRRSIVPAGRHAEPRPASSSSAPASSSYGTGPLLLVRRAHRGTARKREVEERRLTARSSCKPRAKARPSARSPAVRRLRAVRCPHRFLPRGTRARWARSTGQARAHA